MPSTSSLSRPRSSTSSLSNWLIGKPSVAAPPPGCGRAGCASESSTPHGCTAMWRGSPSSCSTSREQSRSQPAARRQARTARSSGRSRSAIRASRARMCGNALAIASISPGGMPERGADVADRVADPVGVHHRDAHAALAAVAVEDRLVDLEPARGLHVDVDVGQRLAQRGEEPLHQQAVADRVDPGDAEQVVDQAARARPAGRAAHAHARGSGR